jgi:quinoprotein glucose dehydrogenase
MRNGLVFVPQQPEPRLLRRRAARRERLRELRWRCGRRRRRRLALQVVHHDLWDYDVPAQPVLVTMLGREAVPAVVVTTKMATSLSCIATPARRSFRRGAGRPEEHRARGGSVTDRFRSGLARWCPRASPDDAWGPSPDERDACRAWISRLRSEESSRRRASGHRHLPAMSAARTGAAYRTIRCVGR